MDINQVARMIEWLDEERRRDKALIVKLEEQINHHQETIDVLLLESGIGNRLGRDLAHQLERGRISWLFEWLELPDSDCGRFPLEAHALRSLSAFADNPIAYHKIARERDPTVSVPAPINSRAGGWRNWRTERRLMTRVSGSDKLRGFKELP